MKFFPYVCLGDPNPEFSKKLIKMLEPYADGFEFGIPFSDPLADGPTIQAASERALKGGMNTDKALAFVKELRKEGFSKEIYFMTYYNILFAYGIARFTQECKGLVQGLVIPDIPLEEQDELNEACKSNNLAIIQLITPTTSEKRVEEITKHARGFVYVVSVTGTTGARKELPDLRKTVEVVKKYAKQPVFVGFGISEKKQVQSAKEQGFDGFIVGSRIIKCYNQKAFLDPLKNVKKLCNKLTDVRPTQRN